MEIEKPNRKLPNILITGTPGVGKTTLGKLLPEYIEGLSFYNVGKHNKTFIFFKQQFSLGEIVNAEKLYKTWNSKYNVPEFDEDMVIDYFDKIIDNEGIVVEFHSSGFFPERYFDLVVLLRTDNTILYDRLKERKYEEEKITENLECEILEVTHDEVYEAYKPEIIMELRNETPEQVEKNIKTIMEWVVEWKNSKT